MQATLTSRRDHNFRVNNRKENRVYNNKLITLYKRIVAIYTRNIAPRTLPSALSVDGTRSGCHMQDACAQVEPEAEPEPLTPRQR